MATTESGQSDSPLVLLCGEDDFSVKQHAKALFSDWCRRTGSMDQEIIDAAVSNSGDALKTLNRLWNGLQSLPFFGGPKLLWFKDCSFLGDDRTAESQAVTENLAALAAELKKFDFAGVRLLISAGKVDKRKTFYKTIEKIGRVELFSGLSISDRDWVAQAETWALKRIQSQEKDISDEALSRLVTDVGPNLRLLAQEIEKVVVFSGDRPRIEVSDIDAVVTRQKQAQAFALGEALGDRDLPRLLQALDDELWEIRTDSQRSEIGLLYGLIAKIRVLLLLKEMIRKGWIKAQSDYGRFKAQLEKIPVDWMPADKRINPQAMHPFVLFKALPQTARYSTDELIAAMERLLECNARLISTSTDPALVLQQALLAIVQRATDSAPPSRPASSVRSS
ncbi:MAG TPA: DNA polymerase III subunit delta [Candidatus Paceibacterota bacterium]|nr:DNA polymerase III subunit delta [Verrucomicrobiota bacterium]HRY46854.1 DNA polymerase III subunit delta [Candidatus Paceibacterota bacterium]